MPKAIDIGAEGPKTEVREDLLGRTAIGDLKRESVRGGFASVFGQGLGLLLQTTSAVVLARLLSPEDYGVQAMVVTLTGFFSLFRDAGLGAATIQQQVLTHEQASTLFWVNVSVGTLLTLGVAAMGPVLVAFYSEPRLLGVAIASGAVFLFHGLAVQHRALLNRATRFVALAKIDLLALTFSIVIGIGMATLGYGYWALVGQAVSYPMVSASGIWLAMPWFPGPPMRGAGVRSMLRFGGTLTLNSFVVYLALNTEKVLLGRFWGVEALGLYARAYQLANLPLQQIIGSIGAVAFPALSRIQGDAERLCRVFLKSYAVVVSLTIPVVISCALFAEELVGTLLGQKWIASAPVFRLLAPTILAFALTNPLSWFLQATGRVVRSLKMAVSIVFVVICGIVSGLQYGPTGVALGYSTAMMLLTIPLIVWATHGTRIAVNEYWEAVKRPLACGAIGSVAGGLLKFACGSALAPVPMLTLGLSVSLGVYAWLLLAVMGQWSLYKDLVSQVLQRNSRQSPKG